MTEYALSERTTAGLPGILKVGGVEYIVSEIEKLTDKDGGKLWGMADTGKGTILIEADQLPILKWQTFFHELGHVCAEHLGLPEPNERTINGIAHFVLALLVDNEILSQAGRVSHVGNLRSEDSVAKIAVFLYERWQYFVEMLLAVGDQDINGNLLIDANLVNYWKTYIRREFQELDENEKSQDVAAAFTLIEALEA